LEGYFPERRPPPGIPWRHKPIHGGCGKNILFFTILKIPFHSSLRRCAVQFVNNLGEGRALREQGPISLPVDAFTSMIGIDATVLVHCLVRDAHAQFERTQTLIKRETRRAAHADVNCGGEAS
jgi:hypothetical protein